ncbi:MAG: hypothetical protein DWQ08_08960 [Proteobacteria bacterium]|nr:MAG: hypothetical protein DWQ08_08960 [Pseudomonadota bacterium]
MLFEGRRDRQVKIRGFRIEPEGVERRIAADEGVARVSVEVEEGAEGRSLVAYVKPRPVQPRGWEQALRQRLAEALPGYMLPARIVEVDALPIGRTGKVDRSILGATRGDSRRLSPGEPAQEMGAGIMKSLWADVLELDSLPEDDSDFFELGGHSLLAIKLVDRVHKRFDCELDPDVLFRAPTPARLLSAVRIARDGRAPPDAQAAGENDKTGYSDDVLARQRRFMRGWRGQRRSPDSLVLALNPESLGPPLLWCAQDSAEVDALTERIGDDFRVYLARSSRFICEPDSPEVGILASACALELAELEPGAQWVVGGFCLGGALAVEVVNRLTAAGRSVRGLFLLEAFRHVLARQCVCHVPALLVFARDQAANPYRRYRRPEIGCRRYLPGLRRLVCIPGTHGALLERGRVDEFESLVREMLVDTSPPSTLAQDGEGLGLSSDAVAPLELEHGAARCIEVRVFNDSGRAWVAAKTPAVNLYARWRGETDEIIGWAAEPLPLPSLSPGAAAMLEVTLDPPAPGVRELEIDLVEEGVSWLSELRGESLLRLPVSVTGRDVGGAAEHGGKTEAAWLERAEAEIQLGDYANAANSYYGAIKASGRLDNRMLNDWFLALHRAERYPEAADAMDALPALLRDDACRLAAGDTFMKLDKPSRAAGVLRNRLAPEYEPERLALLCEALIRIERFDEAMTAAREMAAYCHGSEIPWMLAGGIKSRLGETEQALDDYERARRARVTPDVLVAIAEANLSLARPASAIEALESAMILNAEFARPYELLYDCLEAAGQPDSAARVVEELRKHCRYRPTIERVLDYLSFRGANIATSDRPR